MPVITTCIEPGCSTLCMGLFCIQHDARPVADFPRGRPWPPAARAPRATVVPVQVHVQVPVAAGTPETELTSVRPAA
jgi:hypothetical protein